MMNSKWRNGGEGCACASAFGRYAMRYEGRCHQGGTKSEAEKVQSYLTEPLKRALELESELPSPNFAD